MYVDGGPRHGICARCRRAYMPGSRLQKYCKPGCARKAKRTNANGGPIECLYPHKLKYYSLDYAESRLGHLRRVHNNNRLHAFKCVCGDIHIGTSFPDAERLMNRKISKMAIASGKN